MLPAIHFPARCHTLFLLYRMGYCSVDVYHAAEYVAIWHLIWLLKSRASRSCSPTVSQLGALQRSQMPHSEIDTPTLRTLPAFCCASNALYTSNTSRPAFSQITNHSKIYASTLYANSHRQSRTRHQSPCLVNARGRDPHTLYAAHQACAPQTRPPSTSKTAELAALRHVLDQ